MKSFYPEHIFVHQDAKNDSLTRRVLERLPGVPVTTLSSYGDPISELGVFGDTVQDESAQFTLGKRQLLLTRYRGEWLRACPGTTHHVCCNLWTVNPGEGCPFDCTYCYLHSYLRRNPTLKLFTNTDEMCSAIKDKADKHPARLFRIGTGEIIDSLVWDELTDSTTELVPFFASLPNALLELKTKSNNVSNLVALRNMHNDHTVVSWSVNAQRVISLDERDTASLEDRANAAARVIDAGYRVGIHFDPLIHFDGWEDEYRDAVQLLLARIDPKRIAWVSISTLRYRPEMQPIMSKRFPRSQIPYGEQFLAKDGKMRYIQPLRFRMVRFVWNELKQRYPEIPTYMCMESSAAWRGIAGGPPVAGSELVEIFSRRGRLSAVEQSSTESPSFQEGEEQ